MYQILYEETAEEDLFNITSYYLQEGGMELAKKMYAKIVSQIEKLSFLPFRCPESEYFPNSRVLTLKKLPYRAFFKIDENEKKVFIISVIHSSRQFPN